MGIQKQSYREDVSFSVSSNRPLTLLEFNRLLREEIENALPHRYWIIAEISEARVHYQSGHCYLTLTDKDLSPRSALTAQARATIWKRQYAEIAGFFEAQTGHQLKAGLKILFQASPKFHELYGFSLDIHDIDPTYTLGDLARQRQETIVRLQNEGLFDLNRQHALLEVPQRIAVISSPTAAGYQDFMAQLASNPFGYAFKLTTFKASVQGTEAVSSIQAALHRVSLQRPAFDAVVIIRGGGSQTDLLCFDQYELAATVAQMALPVVTGIGHERDESVTDLVAHTSLKTPTAVAAFLIDRCNAYEAHLEEVLRQIKDAATLRTRTEVQWLSQQTSRLEQRTGTFLQNHQTELESQTRILSDKPKKFLSEEQYQLKCEEMRLTQVVQQLLFSQKNKHQYHRQQLENASTKTIGIAKQNLVHQVHCLQYASEQKTQKMQMLFQKIHHKMAYAAKDLVQIKKHQLQLQEMDIRVHDPERMLQRGYTLTTVNGKLIRSLDQVKPGDKIKTRLLAGSIQSTVIKTEMPDLFQ